MELKHAFSPSQLPNLALVSRNSLEVVVFTTICEKVSIEVDGRDIPARVVRCDWPMIEPVTLKSECQ